jgi:hypothetical protein
MALNFALDYVRISFRKNLKPHLCLFWQLFPYCTSEFYMTFFLILKKYGINVHFCLLSGMSFFFNTWSLRYLDFHFWESHLHNTLVKRNSLTLLNGKVNQSFILTEVTAHHTLVGLRSFLEGSDWTLTQITATFLCFNAAILEQKAVPKLHRKVFVNFSQWVYSSFLFLSSSLNWFFLLTCT